MIDTDNVGSPRAWETVACEDKAYKLVFYNILAPFYLQMPNYSSSNCINSDYFVNFFLYTSAIMSGALHYCVV